MEEAEGTTSPSTAVWLDCDPGHDDAIAIILAGFSPSLRLLGISTVGGNQTLEKVTHNALHIVEAVGLQTDVVSGQSGPLMRHSPFCPEIHGSSGLDSQHGGHLFGNSSPSRAPVQGKAVNVIFSRLAGEFMRSGRRRTRLVCTAPLTNCAVLLLVYPEVREMIEIVTMGGCLGIGNTGPVMEFNIQSDPEAAKIVFQSGVPLTMVPLEVTHTALVTDMVLKRIVTDKPSPFRRMLGDLVTFFAQTYKQVFQFDHPPLHDPCAVAAVIDPGIFQVKVMHVDIETCSLLSPGQTVCDIWGQSGKPANCGVAMTMDVAKFWNLVLDGVAAADRVSPLNEGN